MSIFRYKIKTANNANFYGHGFILNTSADPVALSFTPHFDFYDASGNALFRVTGVAYLAAKANNMRVNFDTAFGNEFSYGDTALPASLDRVRMAAADGTEYMSDDLTDASGNRYVDLTVQGYDVSEATDASGNYTRFTTAGSPTNSYVGDASGNPPAVDDELVVEFSGSFARVEVVMPYPAWQPMTAYGVDHIWLAHQDAAGSNLPAIYGRIATATTVNTATDFDAFVTANGASFTGHTVVDLGAGVFAVEKMNDFNDPPTSRVEFKAAWDRNDIVLLHNEPEVYLDTTAVTNGSGRSRQDPYNELPALDDNTPVLVMAGSTVGSTTFASDALLTVQNGVVGSSGGGAPTIIQNDGIIIQ